MCRSVAGTKHSMEGVDDMGFTSIKDREDYINSRPEVKRLFDNLCDAKKKQFLDYLDFVFCASDEETEEVFNLDKDTDFWKIGMIVAFWKVTHPDNVLYADAPEAKPQFIIRKV